MPLTVQPQVLRARPPPLQAGGQLVSCTRYSAEVQQRPLTAACEHGHQHTELPATTDKRPAAPLVRDEEAAGSNPATPTEKVQVDGMIAKRGDHAIDHLLAIRWRDRTSVRGM